MKLVTFVRTASFDPAAGQAPAMPLNGIGAPVRGPETGSPGGNLSFFGEEVGILSQNGKWVLPAAKTGISYPDMNTLIAEHRPEEMQILREVAAAFEVAVGRLEAREETSENASGASGNVSGEPFPGLAVGSQVRLLSPIPHPLQDVICLGLNYTEHAREAAAYSQTAFTSRDRCPVYFSKRVNLSQGDGEPVPAYEGLVDSLDYEAELAVIIGKDAKGVSAGEAADYIFGYTILNDYSARNLQTRHTQWYLGKSLDGFTPMGPCIVTADAFSFPPRLRITSTVNGEIRQDSTTDMLIFGIDSIISDLSAGMTLKAGTIISTGTPKGVGMGFDPPKVLHAGDVVTCQIEGIGTLTNPICG